MTYNALYGKKGSSVLLRKQSEFAAWLKHYVLVERGMSQQDFAIGIQVSEPTVSQWFNNKRAPSPWAIERIAHGLGMSSRRLLVEAGIIEPEEQDEETDMAIARIVAAYNRLPADKREAFVRRLEFEADLATGGKFDERNIIGSHQPLPLGKAKNGATKAQAC